MDLKRMGAVAGAILLAIVGTFVLVAYVKTAEDRALAGEELVDVLVVGDTIASGTSAAALSGRVHAEQVPVKLVPDGTVTDLADLEGLVARVDLLPGEELVASRFVEPAALGAVDVPEGLLQVTVALSPERALGGNLLAGDTVGVIASFTGAADVDEETSVEEQTHLILHKVLVSNVQRPADQSAPAAGGGSSTTSDASAPRGEFLVTLAISAPSVEKVVFAAEHGTVWLTHEPLDAPEGGTTVQDRGTIYR